MSGYLINPGMNLADYLRDESMTNETIQTSTLQSKFPNKRMCTNKEGEYRSRQLMVMGAGGM